jgi:glutamate carboxypeptidase
MMKPRVLLRWFVAAGLAVFACCMPASADAAASNDQVYDRAQQYQDEAVALLGRLVNIDSGTGDHQGMSAIAAIATAELRALGGAIEFVPNSNGPGENIVARFSSSGRAKILLIAHMDTVFAAGTARERPFRIQGRRAYGPGIQDDKGGIVAALYALKILRDVGFRNYERITLLLNSNEETGSVGSRALIERLAREHDVALNLEPGRPADGLVIWRKGSAVARIEVKGRSAHAGVAPDDGRNAAMELAHQILQLSKLANRALGTTVNFTVLSAGDRSNVIPDSAAAQGDVRAQVPEEFDRVERQLATMSKNKLIPDTEVTTSLTRFFPVMQQNDETDALAAKAQAIYGELGKKLTLEGSGGAADSSFSAGAGTPSLDGLGFVGGNSHSPDEYAELDSVAPRLYLLARLLMELSAAN